MLSFASAAYTDDKRLVGTDEHPHTHRSLDDAIEQGTLFCNMLAEWRASRA